MNDEATNDPVDPGEATRAGGPLTYSGSSVLPEHNAGIVAGLTAAGLPGDGSSADFVMATSDGHAAPAAPRAPHPTLPGYEILGELGRGGMGVVYQARQVRLNRAVALKMILAGQHAGAESAARFLAEAEAVAKLQHPNIVQIFHIDEHAGLPYFEMEFVGGGSLADRLDGTPRRPARRRGWSRPWPAPWPRRTGRGSSTATSSRQHPAHARGRAQGRRLRPGEAA